MIPAGTPVMFGPFDGPIQGRIHAVVIYEDHIRYRIVAWVEVEPQFFELPVSEFQVMPTDGPRPCKIGFHQEKE